MFWARVLLDGELVKEVKSLNQPAFIISGENRVNGVERIKEVPFLHQPELIISGENWVNAKGLIKKVESAFITLVQ